MDSMQHDLNSNMSFQHPSKGKDMNDQEGYLSMSQGANFPICPLTYEKKPQQLLLLSWIVKEQAVIHVRDTKMIYKISKQPAGITQHFPEWRKKHFTHTLSTKRLIRHNRKLEMFLPGEPGTIRTVFVNYRCNCLSTWMEYNDSLPEIDDIVWKHRDN